MRTAWREDPDCSPAELVYGSSLHVPGEFLPPVAPQQNTPSSEFLRHLQTSMRSALPPPPSHHGTRPEQVPTNLDSTGYVYIRQDGYRKPLTRPYSGPHRIVEVHDKYYVVNIDGHEDKVTIDRLKVAHVPTPAAPPVPTPAVPPPTPTPLHTAPHLATPQPLPTSRSGRSLRIPARFQSAISAT